MLLSIDPGTTESAFVLYDGQPQLWGKWDNNTLLQAIKVNPQFAMASHCAIEMIGHYGTGMAVGEEVFRTCFWTGRYIEAWFERNGGEKFCLNEAELVKRPTVKAHICGSAKAKDGNVRQALIDRWGGESVAIGGKRCPKCKGKGATGGKKAIPCDCQGGYAIPPGPLKGISADCWQALALAVYVTDMRAKGAVA